METTKRIVILLVLGLLAAGPAQSAEKQAREISDTLTASCLLRIASDPAVLPLDLQSLDALLHSSGVGGKAARDVLGVSPDEVHDLIQLESVHYLDSGKLQSRPASKRRPPSDTGMDEYMYQMRMEDDRIRNARGSSSRASLTAPTEPQSFTTEKAILVHLNVQLDESAMEPLAEEFMDAVIDNLQSSLLKAFEEYSVRLDDHLNVADKEAARTENDLREKQDMLRRISGSRVLDRNSILRDSSTLHAKIESIEMEQTSEQIIFDSTVEQIVKIQSKTTEQIGNDDVTIELRRMLELHSRNLQNIGKLVGAGQASQTQFADAEERLVRARIELAQRREQLSKSAGGNLIESLNARLADSSIQTAQAKARLSTYKRQLAEAEATLELADDYELLSLKAEIIKQNFREVLVWRDGISRQVRMLQPPSVSALGRK